VAHRAPRRASRDFKRIYDDEDDPSGLAVSIDSDDSRSSAEAYIGRILFTRQ